MVSHQVIVEQKIILKEALSRAVKSQFEDMQKRETQDLIEALNYIKVKEGLILTYDYEDEDEITISGKKIKIQPVRKWLSL